MFTLYYNPYILKVATKREGGLKFSKNGHILYVRAPPDRIFFSGMLTSVSLRIPELIL